MSTLECYPSVFNEITISLLKRNNIRSILDFLHETPESTGKILKMSFKDVLDLRENAVNAFRKKPSTALDLLKQIRENHFRIPTGISEIDSLIGGLESGRIYEVCGLSGSGKTQFCLSIAAHASSVEKRVLFIDTKNDFSARRVFTMLSRKCDKDITIEMERIRVTSAFTLHKLVDVIHWLQNMFTLCPFPLIIIDCISTCYFAHVGGDKPIGYALLNHIASVMKCIITQNPCIFVLTNLATKGFYAADGNAAKTDKSIKPCMGSYWQQISNIRLDFKKIDNNVVAVSVGRNDISDVDDTVTHINLSSI